MGGASSHFADTDWDKNDGGLRNESETLDGRKPTESHMILTLRKTNVVTQREFEVKDDADELLYTTKPIEGTTKNFDLLDAAGTKVFCISTDKARVEWVLYSYSPNWESQEAALSTEGGDLFQKARIDITWNKYHGVVKLFEESDADPKGVIPTGSSAPSFLLVAEEIHSKTAQFQSYVPANGQLLDNAIHPPLIGWWVWEHTARRHQLKMHLAKGTDIALHCVVALVCNMVQVEKKADDSL